MNRATPPADSSGPLVSSLDDLWASACNGDVDAFGDWMGRVERPIRRGLARFASLVDAEGIVQETLLRMWHLSRDRNRSLDGENASLRWALALARNLARNEARKTKRHGELAPGALDDEPVLGPDPDPLLMKRIRECIGKLTGQLGRVFDLRLRFGLQMPDADLAQRARMTRNTFLQNVTRARRQVVKCLEAAGVTREELAR